jgi:hypothetical protein
VLWLAATAAPPVAAIAAPLTLHTLEISHALGNLLQTLSGRTVPRPAVCGCYEFGPDRPVWCSKTLGSPSPPPGFKRAVSRDSSIALPEGLCAGPSRPGA